MSRRFQQRSRTAEFQRQMRLPAAEIYAAFNAPVGIYERYSHAGILILLPALALPSQPIHAARSSKPPRQGMGSSRSEEQTSDLQSQMRLSHAAFCLNKTNIKA